jgi:lysophospholipase L1-like esterase
MTEDDDPYCLRPGESAELLADHPWRRFVVLGDSVAEGLCEPLEGYSDLQWADRLAAELTAAAPELKYLNLGVSGLRAHEIHATQLAPALAFQPDLALLVGGGNDAFSARYDADRVDRELTAMITALQAAGADVITLGMFDVSASPAIQGWLRPGLHQRMRLLSERTRALAGTHGTIHVHLTTHALSTDPGLYSGDGRHGNARSDAVAAAETIRQLGAQKRPRNNSAKTAATTQGGFS